MAGFVDETGVDAVMAAADIAQIFTFQQATDGQVNQMENIRTEALVLARRIVDECPPNYHRSIAIQRVREAVMWANAGIMLEGKVS